MLLQRDIVSLAAKELLPLMLTAEPSDARERAAIELMRRWDNQMDPARPEPLIFAAWVRTINKRLFQPRLGALYGRYWSPSARATQNVLRNNPAWCGDQGCARLTAAALKDALDDLTTRYGATTEIWRWGDAHQASFDHPVFSHIPVLSALFGRHPPAAGAADTINAGGFDANKDETPFADLHGPGLRAVYDLADPDQSTFQIALGESAHVLSPHYDDMQKLWMRFEGIRIVREPDGETLTLLP
jgi:penicillin amidase